MADGRINGRRERERERERKKKVSLVNRDLCRLALVELVHGRPRDFSNVTEGWFTGICRDRSARFSRFDEQIVSKGMPRETARVNQTRRLGENDLTILRIAANWSKVWLSPRFSERSSTSVCSHLVVHRRPSRLDNHGYRLPSTSQRRFPRQCHFHSVHATLLISPCPCPTPDPAARDAGRIVVASWIAMTWDTLLRDRLFFLFLPALLIHIDTIGWNNACNRERWFIVCVVYRIEKKVCLAIVDEFYTFDSMKIQFDVKNLPQNWISRSKNFFLLHCTRHEGKTLARNYIVLLESGKKVS